MAKMLESSPSALCRHQVRGKRLMMRPRRLGERGSRLLVANGITAVARRSASRRRKRPSARAIAAGRRGRRLWVVVAGPCLGGACPTSPLSRPTACSANRLSGFELGALLFHEVVYERGDIFMPPILLRNWRIVQTEAVHQAIPA